MAVLCTYGGALGGGAILGLAATLFLLFNGRILGVSGILGGLFDGSSGKSWRASFIFGLISGGALLHGLLPTVFENTVIRSNVSLVLAGLLVGFGTSLGGGCTSGHGVCGVSRLSPRSLVATTIFMAFGAATVWVTSRWFGGVL